jgi:hypothetical protein
MDDQRTLDRYLTAPVSAVVAFILGVLALMGQNALTIAIGAFAEPATGGTLSGFYLGFGLGVLVQVGLTVLLARRALAGGVTGWESTLARAAVVLAGLALVAGVVALLGVGVSR